MLGRDGLFRQENDTVHAPPIPSASQKRLYLTTAYLRTLIFISLREYGILIFYSSSPRNCTETSSSSPIDLPRGGFIAHLVSLSLDPSARIGKLRTLSVTLPTDLWLTPRKFPVAYALTRGSVFSFSLFTDWWHWQDCVENPKPPQGKRKEAADSGLHPGQGWHCCYRR